MSEIFQFKNSKFENIEDCVKYIRKDCGDNVAGKEFLVTRIVTTGGNQWGTYTEVREEIELQLAEKEN
jgi:pantothenate kinase